VPTLEVGEPGRAGLGEGEAADRVDGHGVPPPGAGVQVAGLAGDLGGVREPELRDRDRLEGAQLDVAAVAGAVQLGDVVPGRWAQRSSRVGWLALTVNR